MSKKYVIYVRKSFVQIIMIKIIKIKKVKGHCNYTGKFRGAAHSDCNLKYKVPRDIPIIVIMVAMILTL